MYSYLEGLSLPEKRNILLEMSLKNIGIGDTERSLSHLNELLSIYNDVPASQRFSEMKCFSLELNVLLRHLSQTYKVHAHYSEELYLNYQSTLNDTTLISHLEKILTKMVKDYIMLIRTYSRRQYSNLIRATLDYVDFHYAEPLTLSGLAERFSVSDSYLSSRFMQETGENLISYINTVRIRYSCTLLAQLQISMQKAAELSGFSSSNYFARVFRQQMGCTPTEYRKQIQKIS